MSIIGIERLVYRVGDVPESARFFDDFGLIRDEVETAKSAPTFVLPEGSRVVIRHREDPALPTTEMRGDGVCEVIWGVADAASHSRLISGLQADRTVDMSTDDGIARFKSNFGIPMGLKVFEKKAVVTAPDPQNSPGRINRLNIHRKWRRRALPKGIGHVVFHVTDVDSAYAFMRDRLGFRMTDSQGAFGKYLRASGSCAHHSMFLINASAIPGNDGSVRFDHANFPVEDIDEIMVGANYMTRRGWSPSQMGLGRHRIDSALFYYIPCPAGGEAEYGADQDAVDDSWVPREWTDPMFGVAQYVSNLPPFLINEPEWKFEYIVDLSATRRSKVDEGGA